MIWAGILAGLGRREAEKELSAHLREPVAWLDVLAEARRLRVVPLLYAAVQRTATDVVPRPVMESLRRATLAAGARSARLEQTGASVATAARAEGISVLVLKGLALQSLVYPAGIVRQMDDVDLLISSADGPKLGALLRRRGYRNDLRGEEDFFAPDRSHSIDVHSDLVNTTRLPARGGLWPEPFEEIWRRRQPFAMGGVTAWTLGSQDCIRHIALHAVHHHGMQGGLWMADLAAALQTWPTGVAGMGASPDGVRRSVWYCLEGLASRGHDPSPDNRAALRPRRLLPGERHLLSSAAKPDCSSHIRYAFTLACLPGWATRAAFLRQLLFPRDAIHEGFSDAGPVPRRAWMAHWGNLVRLVAHQGFHGRPDRRGASGKRQTP